MAAATVSAQCNTATKDGALRLNLGQHGLLHKSRYKSSARVYNPRDNLIERQLSKVSEKIDNSQTLPEPVRLTDDIKQYTGIASDDESLTYRSLPPIKLSFKQSKSKFMESPRGDTSSVFQPSYSIKTNREGHHVFTEGISKISTTPNPTFALKNIKVPYSNLPDNVSIHKEKNKFALGVKQENKKAVCKSPYRLSDRPMGYASADLIHHLGIAKRKQKTGIKNSENFKENLVSNGNQGFECKLAPIDDATSKEFVFDYPYAGRFEPAAEPLVPENTVRNSKSPTKAANAQCRERSVSVVSIGDSVTPTFFDRAKRKTRKLYPMYDAKAAQIEALTKSKFGIKDVNCTKSNTNNTDTNPTLYRSNTKLSTTLLDLDLSECRDSRRNRTQKPKKRMKGILTPLSNYSPTKTYKNDPMYDSDPEFDLSKIYNTKLGRYQLRKSLPKFRKRAQRPTSSDSNSSTDMSTMIHNPPPSEISHAMQDDVATFAGIDTKTEMMTLMEERERTKTASALSVSAIKDPKKAENNLGDRNQNDDNSNPTESTVVKTVDDLSARRSDINQDNKEENLSNAAKQRIDKDMHDVTRNLKNDASKNDKSMPTLNFYNVDNVRIHPHDNRTVIDSQLNIIPSSSATKDANVYNENAPKEDNRRDQTTDESENESSLNGFPNRSKMVTDFEKTIVEEYKEAPGELHNFHRNRSVRSRKPKHAATLPVPNVSLDKLAHHPLLPYNQNSESFSRSLQNTQLDLLASGNTKEKDVIDTNSMVMVDGEVLERQILLPVTQIRLRSPDTNRTLITPAVSLIDELNGFHQGFIADMKPDSDRSDKKLVNSKNISFTSPMITEPKAKRQ